MREVMSDQSITHITATIAERNEEEQTERRSSPLTTPFSEKSNSCPSSEVMVIDEDLSPLDTPIQSPIPTIPTIPTTTLSTTPNKSNPISPIPPITSPHPTHFTNPTNSLREEQQEQEFEDDADGLCIDSTSIPMEKDEKTLHFKVRSQSSTLVLNPKAIDEVISREDSTVLQDDSGELITVVTDGGLGDIHPIHSTNKRETVKNGTIVSNHHEDESGKGYLPVITRIERSSSLSLQGGLSTDDQAKSSSSAASSSCSLHSRISSSLMNAHYTPSTYPSQQTANRIEMIPLRNQHLFQQDCGFTRHQAIEYWIQKKIIQSRGEGANLLHLLMALGIIEHRKILDNFIRMIRLIYPIK